MTTGHERIQQMLDEIVAKDLEIERLKKLCEEVIVAFDKHTIASSGPEYFMVQNWRSQLTTPKER